MRNLVYVKQNFSFQLFQPRGFIDRHRFRVFWLWGCFLMGSKEAVFVDACVAFLADKMVSRHLRAQYAILHFVTPAW